MSKKDIDAQFRRLEQGAPVRATGARKHEIDLLAKEIDEALKEEFLASRKYFDLADEAQKLKMPFWWRLRDIGRVEEQHYRKLEEIATSILKIKAKRGLI